jgi:hypothetical protein
MCSFGLEQGQTRMMIRHLCAFGLMAVLAAIPAMSQAQDTSKPMQVAQLSRDEVKASVQAETLRLKKHGPKRIWCVPFARAVSGINIRGDAHTWWKKAGADYVRGNVPVSGSVLNFRASGKMRRGHVAVVSKVIDSRTILVDQANWVRNRITLDDVVVDVSPNNDWSAVRVSSGGSALGRINPTYGFIYLPHDAKT